MKGVGCRLKTRGSLWKVSFILNHSLRVYTTTSCSENAYVKIVQKLTIFCEIHTWYNRYQLLPYSLQDKL